MPSFNNDPVISVSASTDTPAVRGEGTGYEGVRGVSHNAHGAVVGINDFAPTSPPGAGGNGAWFESAQGEGVRGWAKSAAHGGVVGVNTAGGIGVYGTSDAGIGVVGVSKTSEGVRGTSDNAGHGGVVGVNTAGGDAGFFQGNVHVTGTLTADVDITLANADCAEDFDLADQQPVEPGTTMVLDDYGAVRPSTTAYDRRVAGVVSGAGAYRPALRLDRRGDGAHRQPIALLGKVYCKVDAQYGSIVVGDLLTTSPTSGHAMKATHSSEAFGAILGKALRPLAAGQALIPILVALQ